MILPGVSRSAIVARLRSAGCVFAEDEAELLIAAAGTPAELTAMVDRRVSGLPLEQVVGWADFCGLRIAVEPGVFVPRRRTEFLVRQAIAIAPPQPIIVDLCCGSGAVGAALAAALHPAELHAADIDPVAVRCARRNIGPAGGHVYAGDLFAPLPADLRGRVGILAANVPYVPTAEVSLLPAEARLHEPRVALDGGGDGLDILRRVAAEAALWLAEGGSLLAETTRRQEKAACDTARRGGLVPRVAHSPELAASVLIASKATR